MEKQFNQLTPAEAERLAMLGEEAGEIVQAVGKILRHGFESRHPDGGPTNRESLHRELIDIQGVIMAMHEARDLINADVVAYNEGVELSWQRKLKYSHHQSQQ